MNHVSDPVATKEYRGYTIKKFALQQFEVWKSGFRMTTCGSWWGCIIYVDELLAP